MDLKELRVGNYLKLLGTRFGTQTIELKKLILSSLLENNDSIKYFKPIPLTEKWLLDFGFLDLGCGEYKKGTILLDNEYTDKGVWYVQEDSSLLNIDVIHVHQLQNLHFALTNQELTNK